MRTLQLHLNAPVDLGRWGLGWMNVAVRSYSRYLEYRRTVQELRGLADDELNDLEISRADIPRIAAEAVYG